MEPRRQLLRLVLVLAALQPGLTQQRADDDRARRRCGQGEATCGDGRCIDYRRLCDGRVDCVDGSDETDCGTNRCQPNELQCANGKCTMKHWRCDGDDDCGDGTDEQNCQQRAPGSQCDISEFQCSDRSQCIPRSYHCDRQNDCLDLSDEQGCSAPVIVEQPPAVNVITIGGVFIIRCRAVGTPTPEISWRRNWRHVPDKCRQESVEGRGTLTCPDAATTDQGAYSCEAINTQGVVFAVPDTNVVVTDGGICQPPEFNSAALTNDDCLRCFCFGASTECTSSSLFLSEMPAPDPSAVSIHTVERAPGGFGRELRPRPDRPYPGRDGDIQVQLSSRSDSFFVLPRPYTGSLLNSYGGYLRFQLSPAPEVSRAQPEVIIQGNGMTIFYRADVRPTRGEFVIQLVEGNFYSGAEFGPNPKLASREEIMMALQNVDKFAITAPYSSARRDPTTLSGLRMDTASRSRTRQGPAALVEQCRCPPGYTGNSCQDCAPGFTRRPSRERFSLGTCELGRPAPPSPPPVPERCPEGEYGDPGRGVRCRPCPCPGGQQQNGRTCYLDADGQVTCNCDPGYGGRRCERCQAGYRGDPSRGQPCQPGGECDPAGSVDSEPDPRTGQCNCKEFVTGRRCDRCVPRAFYLSTTNQHGCISCFCSGVTDQCTSSQWYRQQETAVFIADTQDITLSDDLVEQSFEGVSLDPRERQLIFKDFDRLRDKPAYWSLPARFLGDKVTAYGGFLRINMSFSAPPGAEPFPDYPDIEIFGNDVRLGHLVAGGLEAGRPVALSVPLLETAWRRDDGGPVDREHLLIALADLEYIIFKAADARGATEARLSAVELDTATQRFTGQQPAHAVEQCSCPQGYRGLSCEDCDVGFTRSLAGLYLRSCTPCSCGGRSDECDPETGECLNCRENTAGPECGVCRDGYEGDPSRGRPCRPLTDRPCDCDPRGSRSDICDARRQCDCKARVEGNHCDRCRPGSFGLGTDLAAGCSACFCSGVSRQCSVAQLYRSQLPMSVLDSQHGVTLSNSEGITIVANGGIQFSAADNEVSYRVTASQSQETLYWVLPDLFNGDQLRSYGGTLMVRQRLQLRSRAGLRPDSQPGIILYGGGVELRLRAPFRPESDGRPQTFSVRLSPEEGWVDGETGGRADRRLLLTALSDVEAVLVRATFPFTDGELNTYLSNAVLDTAIATGTQDGLIDTIEQCRCPAEYQGLSCQECAPRHYRAADDSCRPCPCSGNERSCELDDAGDVVCDCRPSFSGRRCQTQGGGSGNPSSGDGIGGQASSGGGSRGDQASSGGGSRGDQASSGGGSRNDQASSGGGSRNDQASSGGGSRGDQASSGGGPVVSAPRVTIDPRYLQLEAGQPAELRCEASGSPPPSLTWSGGRDSRLEDDVSVVDGALLIGAVQKVHEAEYTCTATNEAGTDSLRTIIYVSEGRPASRDDRRVDGRDDRRDDRRLPSGSSQGSGQRLQMEVAPGRDLRLAYGRSARLSCRPVRGSPLPTQVTWRRADGRPLPATASSDGASLIFSYVTGDETGEYVCTASVGGVSVTVTANVYVEPGAAPIIRLNHPDTYRVVEGERVELVCYTEGTPPADLVSWSEANWSEVTADVGRATAVLKAVSQADAGDYRCSAENAYGRSERQLRLLVAPAASGRPAEFVAGPAGGSVRTGRDVYQVPRNGRAELSCAVRGDGSGVTLSWMRSGGLPMPTDHSVRAGTLYINAVQKEAEGVYTCLGIGGAGVVLSRADATLRVLEPPRIQLLPVRQVVQPGQGATIQCRTTGDPPIEVAWSRLQQSLPETAYIKDGALLFTSVAESDAGRYICLAENKAGRAEGIAELIVREGDSIVAFERDVLAYTGSAVTLRCDSSSFGGRIRWSRRDGGPLPASAVADDTSLTLRGVDERDAGEYLCSLQSRAGGIFSDSIILTVEPVPPAPLTRACPPTTLPCGSGECLPIKYFCNGRTDCIDGSDEQRCSLQSDQPAA